MERKFKRLYNIYGMKKAIGIILIILIFATIFIFATILEGWLFALISFGVSIAITGIVFLAMWLITSD